MIKFLKGLLELIMKILKNVFVDLPMFLTRNNFTGDLNIRRDSLAIKDSIKNIILTLFHERPFDPEFGTNVLTGLFENPNDFSFYVENTIATGLERYEPRIKLKNITSTFEDRTLSILIQFKILNYDVYDQLSFTLDSSRYLRVPQAPDRTIPFQEQFDIVFKYLMYRYEPGWSASNDILGKQETLTYLGISGASNPFQIGGAVMGAFQFVANPSTIGASAGWFDPVVNPRYFAQTVRQAYKPFERARSPQQASHKFIAYNSAGLVAQDVYYNKGGPTNTFFKTGENFRWYPDFVDTSDAFRETHTKILGMNVDRNYQNKISRFFLHSPYGSFGTVINNASRSGVGAWRNIPWLTNRYTTEAFRFDAYLMARENTTIRDMLADPSVTRDANLGVVINGVADTYLNKQYSGLTFPNGMYSITQGYAREGGHTLPVTVGTPWIKYPKGITWTGGWFGGQPAGLCFDKRTLIMFDGSTFGLTAPTLNDPSTSFAGLPAGSLRGISYEFGERLIQSLDDLSAEWSDRAEFIAYLGLLPYGPLYETEVPWLFFKDPTVPENVRYMKWRLDASVSHWKEKFKSPIDGFAHVFMDASAVIDRTYHQYQAPSYTQWKNITPSGISFVENIPVSWAKDQYNYTRGPSGPDANKGIILGTETFAHYMFKHDAYYLDNTNTEQSRYPNDTAPRHWCLDDDKATTLYSRSYDLLLGQRRWGFTYSNSIWGMGVCGSSELGEIFAIDYPKNENTVDAYPFFYNSFIEYSSGAIKWKRLAGTTFGDGGGVPWNYDRRFRLFYMYPTLLALNTTVVDHFHDGLGYYTLPFSPPESGWYDITLGKTFMGGMESGSYPVVSDFPYPGRKTPTKPPQNYWTGIPTTSEFELLYACMKGGVTQGLNSLGFNSLFNYLFERGATGFNV